MSNYHPNDNTYIFCHAPGCKRLRQTCVWYMGSKEQDLTIHLPPDLRSPQNVWNWSFEQIRFDLALEKVLRNLYKIPFN